MKSRFFAPTTSLQGVINFLVPSEDDPPEKKIIAVSGVVSFVCLSLILVLLSTRHTPQGQSVEEMAEKSTVAPPIMAKMEERAHTLQVKSTADLLENLQNRDLWDIGSEETVQPVLFANFPRT